MLICYILTFEHQKLLKVFSSRFDPQKYFNHIHILKRELDLHISRAAVKKILYNEPPQNKYFTITKWIMGWKISIFLKKETRPRFLVW